jgi:hypothetical protein
VAHLLITIWRIHSHRNGLFPDNKPEDFLARNNLVLKLFETHLSCLDLVRVVPVKPTRSVGALEATRRVLEDQEAQQLTTRRKPRGVKQESRGLDAKKGRQIKYYFKEV